MSDLVPHSRPWILPSDIDAVAALMQANVLADGSVCQVLRKKLSILFGLPRVELVATGSAGIATALSAAGVGGGDEVITPTYACGEVAAAVEATGASTKLCDIGDGWLMTPDTVARAMTPRVKAIVLVSLFGLRLDARPFRAFGIPVIGDLCQNFNAAVPSLEPELDRGDYFVCSFRATKCVPAGFGGAVAAVNDQQAAALADAVAKLSWINAFSDLQASIVISHLDRLESANARRHSLESLYLRNIPAELTAHWRKYKGRSPAFRFIIRQDSLSFDSVASEFRARGVIVRRGVDAMLHRHENAESFLGAERCFRETVSIPFHPSLDNAEAERVAANCKAIWPN